MLATYAMVVVWPIGSIVGLVVSTRLPYVEPG